jgi:hypothetical protein
VPPRTTRPPATPPAEGLFDEPQLATNRLLESDQRKKKVHVVLHQAVPEDCDASLMKVF